MGKRLWAWCVRVMLVCGVVDSVWMCVDVNVTCVYVHVCV